MDVTKVSSGVEWEERFGYCRAQRLGDRILVAGTTATGPEGPVHLGDAGAQASYALDKIERALTALGGTMADVVRTRVYVKPGADWEAAVAAHGERFQEIRPVNTTILAAMIGDEYLVEIEVEAIAGSGQSPVHWLDSSDQVGEV